ncbi:unnamed protein product [Enterobius vermicularis]|uniref:PSP1 C-terminal domain-containing protein n=1 Tax=Enterobius vermicularis TaxID=51028 RepID=A0A0N4VNN3_ENTVE|nr:unnamed protein product [Enterobius vermicularis]
MCGRKISQVKFDEAGYQSIESKCYMYDKDKWKFVYALCTQPSDFRSVILYIYRNHKHRIKKKELLSLASDTFYGIESGFELRKKSNTLSLITSKTVLTLAFLTVEHFTMWECWLDAAFSKGAQFFGQLIKAPFKSLAYSCINREISIYVHDFGLALATGRPLYLIGHWALAEIKSVDFYADQLRLSVEQSKILKYGKEEFDYRDSYGNYASIGETEEAVYQIVCWQIPRLKEAFNAAKAGRLRALLSKVSESGHWLNGISKQPASKPHNNRQKYKVETAIDHFNNRYEATYYNEP